MITNCPVCGKAFDVLWPQLYRYRRDGKYLCSYQCMVQYDRKEGKEMTKISPEQKRKAVEIALEGGDPKPFLKECGSKNPENLWYWIKNRLKVEDPETYEMLAKGVRKKRPEIPEPVSGGPWEKMEVPEDVVIDAAKVMLPDPPKAVKPVDYGIFLMDVIRSPETGARYEFKENLLFVKYGPDEFVMEPKDWRKLIDEIPKAAAVLGVEL